MHVGQHDAIDLNLVSNLAPCTPEEYSELFEELVGQGYDDLVIGKRVTQKDFQERKRSVGK